MGEKSKASGLRRGRKGAWLAMREKVLHCIRCTDGKDRRKKSGHFRQAYFSFLLLLILLLFFCDQYATLLHNPPRLIIP